MLKDEIASKRNEIRSDGYPMSIGEIISLYERDELDIHPEFQRVYRWDDNQKSRLIESLLLGIPLPSFFVSQREDGVWDVIDGLQRLATIFQFVGLYKDKDGKLSSPLELVKTKYLPSLGGKVWEDETDPKRSIGVEHQLLIKRSKIDIKIIERESSPATKYELFQRLNTGGSQLTDQELRNCILIMVNQDAYEWLTQLSQNQDFQTCIALTDKASEEQYDVELVVRFLVFRLLPEPKLKRIGDIGEFLTDELIKLGGAFRKDTKLKSNLEKAFKFTFQNLAAALANDSFKRYDGTKERFLGGFLLSAFEALAIGLGSNYERFQKGSALPDLRAAAVELWKTPQFINNTGSGVRASSRIPVIIPLGRSLFNK